VLLHVPKLFDILDMSRPFVPMRATVAALLNMRASTSSRPWLFWHWTWSGATVAFMFVAVVGRQRHWWRAFLIMHGVMILSLLDNFDRFGGVPTWIAIAVNLGTLSFMLITSWYGYWTAFVVCIGIPSFAEAAALVGAFLRDLLSGTPSLVSQPLALVILWVAVLVFVAHMSSHPADISAFYRSVDSCSTYAQIACAVYLVYLFARFHFDS
jgi:hypothetical protein